MCKVLKANNGGDFVSSAHLSEPLQVQLAADSTLLVQSLLFC